MLKELETFYSVVDNGSFTKAASASYLTQPAVTVRIKQLEESLGVTLFERQPHGAILTDEGRRLYEESRSVYELFMQAVIPKDRKTELPKSELKIGILEETCSMTQPFGKIIESLCAKNLSQKLTIKGTSRRTLASDLKEGKIDFVGLAQDIELESEGLIFESLASEGLYACIPSNDGLSKYKAISYKDLSCKLVSLCYLERTPIMGTLRRMLETQGCKIVSSEETPPSPFIGSTCQASGIILIMPKSYISRTEPLMPIPFECGMEISLGFTFASTRVPWQMPLIRQLQASAK